MQAGLLRRRGELLSRLITDVDAQQDLLVRVLLPAASAAVVGLVASLGIGLLLPGAGLVLAAGFAVAGIAAPALTAWAAHRTERSVAAARGAVLARAVERGGAVEKFRRRYGDRAR